jgi:hypothetical protein
MACMRAACCRLRNFFIWEVAPPLTKRFQVSVINQIEGLIITLRDGRDQVKFPPACGKPTTFRAKCERPLQSVMNFGSAALN